jgi:DNA polymerase/3'-5' exonuclease PolX
MSSTRTNAEVAAVFVAIAEILEGQGENPFKIKAYRGAVRTLDSLEEAVADVAARGELRKLPGFGEAIASKTQEILATGTCELHERLKKEQEMAEATESEAEEELVTPEDPSVSETEDIASPW